MLHADFLIADRRQLIGAEIGEDVADAEKTEADDDQAGEDRKDRPAKNVLRHDTQATEHGFSLVGRREGAEGLFGRPSFDGLWGVFRRLSFGRQKKRPSFRRALARDYRNAKARAQSTCRERMVVSPVRALAARAVCSSTKEALHSFVLSQRFLFRELGKLAKIPIRSPRTASNRPREALHFEPAGYGSVAGPLDGDLNSIGRRILLAAMRSVAQPTPQIKQRDFDAQAPVGRHQAQWRAAIEGFGKIFAAQPGDGHGGLIKKVERGAKGFKRQDHSGQLAALSEQRRPLVVVQAGDVGDAAEFLADLSIFLADRRAPAASIFEGRFAAPGRRRRANQKIARRGNGARQKSGCSAAPSRRQAARN
ncbi:hypothetical protein [Rhodoblastus sp.]|uniref:hypothetical protein n=1 Tax=Rhodoblastus sp. TaxID=1962975 RepID=UPI003F9CF2A2